MMRAKWVRWSREILADMMTQGAVEHFEVIQGLPEGAILKAVAYNLPDVVSFLFTHESFEDVDPTMVPNFEVVLRSLDE